VPAAPFNPGIVYVEYKMDGCKMHLDVLIDKEFYTAVMADSHYYLPEIATAISRNEIKHVAPRMLKIGPMAMVWLEPAAMVDTTKCIRMTLKSMARGTNVKLEPNEPFKALEGSPIIANRIFSTVSLEGICRCPIVAGQLLTLPEGYRPSNALRFYQPVVDAQSMPEIVQINIYPSGVVNYSSRSAGAHVSLSGIAFVIPN
jgi:hypothetical protein